MSHACDIIIAKYINLGSPARFWLSPSLQLPLHYPLPHEQNTQGLETRQIGFGPLPQCQRCLPKHSNRMTHT